MNIELLIKFVRLATNNPNENEANVAARRVCKMIADNGYSLNGSKAPSKNYTVTEEYPRNPTRPKSPFDDWYDMWFNESTGRYTKPTNSYQEEYRNRGRGRTDSTRRVCSKCGLGVDTSSKTEPFICGICNIRNDMRGW